MVALALVFLVVLVVVVVLLIVMVIVTIVVIGPFGRRRPCSRCGPSVCYGHWGSRRFSVRQGRFGHFGRCGRRGSCGNR